MTKDDVVAKIREAFADVVYPGDTNIVVEFMGDTEREELRDSFRGKSWQSIPNDLLFYERGSLPFFTNEGYKYYLPAFLIFAITGGFDEADTLLDNLISQLTLPTEMDVAVMTYTLKSMTTGEHIPEINYDDFLRDKLRNHDQYVHDFIARFSLFTRKQGEAIKHFLAFVQQAYGSEFPNNEPAVAIKRYWFQFTDR